MRIDLSLTLPRDSVTVPVSRHICKNSLANLGVDDETVHDIELAVSEACTNVLDHAGPGEEYEITIEIDSEWCVIRVVDSGTGFDSTAIVASGEDSSDERGRGIQLMRHLVDRVNFASRPEEGTIVRLEKRLGLTEASPLRRFVAAEGGEEASD